MTTQIMHEEKCAVMYFKCSDNHLQTIKQAEKYYVFILKEGPEYVVLCQLATTNHWEQLTTAKQGKIKNPLITP